VSAAALAPRAVVRSEPSAEPPAGDGPSTETIDPDKRIPRGGHA
jgi:hypothetical protein